MQKRQAKLHLSVTDILNFRATLPFLSIRLLIGGLEAKKGLEAFA
jgi:hypothetical protein